MASGGFTPTHLISLAVLGLSPSLGQTCRGFFIESGARLHHTRNIKTLGADWSHLETSRQQTLPLTSQSIALASSMAVWGWGEGEGEKQRGIILKDLAFLIH